MLALLLLFTRSSQQQPRHWSSGNQLSIHSKCPNVADVQKRSTAWERQPHWDIWSEWKVDFPNSNGGVAVEPWKTEEVRRAWQRRKPLPSPVVLLVMSESLTLGQHSH